MNKRIKKKKMTQLIKRIHEARRQGKCLWIINYLPVYDVQGNCIGMKKVPHPIVREFYKEDDIGAFIQDYYGFKSEPKMEISELVMKH